MQNHEISHTIKQPCSVFILKKSRNALNLMKQCTLTKQSGKLNILIYSKL